METKYKTDPVIREELAHLLRWYKLNSSCDHSYESMLSYDLVDAYLAEKNIAFHGELRRIHGANTRNAKKELAFAVLLVLTTIVASFVSFTYFGWGEKINSFIEFTLNHLK